MIILAASVYYFNYKCSMANIYINPILICYNLRDINLFLINNINNTNNIPASKNIINNSIILFLSFYTSDLNC